MAFSISPDASKVLILLLLTFFSPGDVVVHRSPSVAEAVVVSHEQEARVEPLAEDRLHELPGRQPAQLLGEWQHGDGSGESLREERELFLLRGEERWRAFGAEDRFRVTVEGDGCRLQAFFCRQHLELMQQEGVP